MSDHVDVAVIGGGQAGLSASYVLTRAGREHVVLERHEVAHSWRGRWDSFRLVLPNWTMGLAGRSYEGGDPDGFLGREEIVHLLVDYAESFGAPVRTGVSVTSLSGLGDGTFLLATPEGELTASEVVVATGSFQRPRVPAAAAALGNDLPLIVVDDYRNPEQLPAGAVLIVGSGQAGCQLAEELTLAGREVVLACGRAPWIPRRMGDHDSLWWLVGSPFFTMTADDLPSPQARLAPNPQVTGAGGGHDVNYRTLQALGVRLVGHLVGRSGDDVVFAPDLADSVAFGDARYGDVCRLVNGIAEARGVAAPDLAPPPPFAAPVVERLPLDRFGAVIVAAGYRPDYLNWVRFPGAFDAMGLPIQHDGTSSVVPGLHFLGVPFLRTRASSTLLGVGADAEALAFTLMPPARAA